MYITPEIFTVPKPHIAKTGNMRRQAKDENQISIFDWLTTTTSAATIADTVILAAEDIAGFTTKNYRIKDSDLIFNSNGAIEKIRCNLEAIRILKTIEGENRESSADEQAILARYTGWGGLSQIFKYYDNEWWAQKEELKNLLTEEEYESARASTPNAHYTSPDVIRFIYDALSKMGFKGGRILEPSMGIGYFFGLMPENILKKSKLAGVELDSISGRISKLLYPDADIRVAGFEETKFPECFFDVIVSNVPFGDYRVHDPKYNRYKASIHDYFFLKAIDLVSPGGIVAFITSRYTLDKNDPKIRRVLYDKADLIAAVRLPNTAFKSIANTEVVTDIVFLQKRIPGAVPIKSHWVETVEHKFPDGTNHYINEYFYKNPRMVAGRLAATGSMYGKDEITVEPTGNLPETLSNIFNLLPEKIFSPVQEKRKQQVDHETVPAPDYLKNGAFAVVDGKLYRNAAGALLVYETPADAANRIEGMVNIRDAVRALLHDEMRTEDDISCSMRRACLNTLYDSFIKKYGYINNTENKKAFSDDPDYPLLLSLEVYDSEAKTAAKADIFEKRVIRPVKKIERTDTVKESFLVSLNELGAVDFQRMSELTGKSEEEIQSELDGIIFKNPQGGKWETADEYLSGNVREKLFIAEIAAAVDPSFSKNVDSLKAVQPKDLDFTEIYANLGAPWIPADDVREFIVDILDVQEWRKGDIKVGYASEIGTWSVEVKDYYINDKVENTKKWGTSSYTAIELIEAGLNHKIPTVYDFIDEKRIVNIKETEAAREKLYLIKEKFREWIWQKQERRERLVKLYNELFNSLRMRQFDGSHLTLPGISSNITLKPHQKDAIWRIIQTGNTLLAHVVGGGSRL